MKAPDKQIDVVRGPFVSSVPYRQQRIFAAAVHCSDGRLGEHIDDFLQNGLALPRYDRVACPGGPVALSGRFSAYWETRGVEEQLRFLAHVHEIRRVVLIAHTDCAYYSRCLGFTRTEMESEQKEDLEKAFWAVQRIIPGIDVERYYARISGEQVRFETL
jgi:hypothetical protein